MSLYYSTLNKRNAPLQISAFLPPKFDHQTVIDMGLQLRQNPETLPACSLLPFSKLTMIR